MPRLIRTAPNGDLFLADSGAGTIFILRGIGPNGKPRRSSSSQPAWTTLSESLFILLITPRTFILETLQPSNVFLTI